MTSPVQERSEVLADLEGAARLLTASINPRLIPPKGGNIGYAVAGARDSGSVAAITGGLVTDGESVRCAGPAAFGVDQNLSRMILTVMKFDPQIRSAGILRYSDEAYSVISGICVDSAETDPKKFPEGAGTMDWAVASCCSSGVPGVIAFLGDGTDHGIICLFGEDPREIVSNIIILSNRIQ